MTTAARLRSLATFMVCIAMLAILAACQPPDDAADNAGTSGYASDTSGASADDNAAWMPDVAKGREQMIRAFDAAWVRILADGRADAVLETLPPSNPGLAKSYFVRLADCLPLPELTPYPQNPTGLLKKVLDTGQIRRLIQDVPNTPDSMSYYFSGAGDAYLDLIIAEIENHYGVEIEVIDVAKPPGPLASTSALLDDEVDFVSQLNATGGRTQDMRRRTSRRFGCTMSSIMQFMHVPEDREFTDELNSFADLKARPDLKICAGPLATQTVKAFLPEHEVVTRYIADIKQCDERIKDGKLDVMIGPLPDLKIAGVDGYKSLHTMIVAGTPYWVATENVECEAPTSPRDEGLCREIDPL